MTALDSPEIAARRSPCLVALQAAKPVPFAYLAAIVRRSCVAEPNGVDKCQLSARIGCMARPRHPDKHIELAVQHAEHLGWRVQLSHGHARGHFFAPKLAVMVVATRSGPRLRIQRDMRGNYVGTWIAALTWKARTRLFQGKRMNSKWVIT